MTPLLAAMADEIIETGFKLFLAVVVLTAPFAVVYWFIRRAKSKREDAQRKAWIEERRAKREQGKDESSSR